MRRGQMDLLRAAVPPREPLELAEVAVAPPARQAYTYLVPPSLRGRLQPGMRVKVPFGRRQVEGYYLGPGSAEQLRRWSATPDRLKPVVGLIDPEPLLDEAVLKLCRFMSEYYFASLWECLSAALPGGVRAGAAPQAVRLVSPAAGPEKLLAGAEALSRRAPKQAALLRALYAVGEPVLQSDLLSAAKAGFSSLKALEKTGLVTAGWQPAEADPTGASPERHLPESFTLTADQQRAVTALSESVQQRRFQTFLLEGVTGSGKTEVYLRTLERALAAGRSGMVLVPEIALTPQTAGRFRACFPQVSVLHSHLTPGARAEQWRRLRRGESRVVVGARSAIFAPVVELGLIVVDEEHETSYKQETNPRYHARDLAIVRGQMAAATVVLGSATPSLESYYHARRGKYRHLVLKSRVQQRPMPAVKIIDIRRERQETKRYTILSRALSARLRAVLDRQEQVILFLNRRGHSPLVTCLTCGWVAKCRQCDISLVYHKRAGKLRCHYCDGAWPPPVHCQGCGKGGLRYVGVGTEKIEEAVQALFPTAQVARMDSDTLRSGRRRYLELLTAFREGRLQVLVGTQMIAKGLDFPNVTLVGIVNADVALHLPDFRATERTFQVLAQVAGRSGRGEKGGEVYIQTALPRHPALRCAATHDFQAFADQELPARRLLRYPPFARLARIIVRGKNDAQLRQKMTAVAAALAEAITREQQTRAERTGTGSGPSSNSGPNPVPATNNLPPVLLVGPSPCPLESLRGELRHHLLLKAPDAVALAFVLESAREALASSRGVQLAVDVDPLSML